MDKLQSANNPIPIGKKAHSVEKLNLTAYRRSP
jgi:hypothetical protein